MRTLTEKNLVEFIGKDSTVVPPRFKDFGVAFVSKAGMMYRFVRTSKGSWKLYEKQPLLDFRQIQKDRNVPSKAPKYLNKEERLEKYKLKQLKRKSKASKSKY